VASLEYAPKSIQAVFDRLVELRPRVAWVNSGIVGDSKHTYGYHRARAVLPRDDYSVTLLADRAGPRWAASALDITPPDTAHQSRLTRRLLRATLNHDPRIAGVVREWYGSLDGMEVAGYDLAAGAPATSDNSHLFHVHLSFYRCNLGVPGRLRPVGDVLAGRPGVK
jgi:hypothetical protein